MRSEVKGVWFATARRYIAERHGEHALARVVKRMAPAHRGALTTPMVSSWYPEESLQEAFIATSDILADRDPARMQALFEECSVLGVHRFWRVALRATSPEFAARALPATWRHMRRGPGTLAVEVAGSEARVYYAHFPYFDDVNYRLLVIGTVGPLMRLSTRGKAEVTILGHGKDWLTARIGFG